MREAYATRALQRCPTSPWSGGTWRVHQRRFQAADGRGSLLYSGRWNRGLDYFPRADAFPALYTSTSPNVATWEYIRHSSRDDGRQIWARFLALTQTKQHVTLPKALDLRDPSPAGFTVSALIGDDYMLPQEIAATAYAAGMSGLLVPTATRLDEQGADFNVIVFLDILEGQTRPRAGTAIELVMSQTPNLPEE